MKKYLIISVLLFLVFGCSSVTKKFDYYTQKRIKNSEKDTIYILFKEQKYATKKKYVNDSLNDNYHMYYKLNFKKSKKFFDIYYFSHRVDIGNKDENLIIEKDENFLHTIKNKTFKYSDFKNKSTKEINLFYYRRNYSTIYLIDKEEFKNGKIFLRKVSLGGNFPKIQ